MTDAPEPGSPAGAGESGAEREPGSGPRPGSGAESGSEGSAEPHEPARRRPRQQRKQVLLRLDPAVHDALARWAAAELRSTNAQIDYLLRKALKNADRHPKDARPHPRRGRPPREE